MITGIALGLNAMRVAESPTHIRNAVGAVEQYVEKETPPKLSSAIHHVTAALAAIAHAVAFLFAKVAAFLPLTSAIALFDIMSDLSILRNTYEHFQTMNALDASNPILAKLQKHALFSLARLITSLALATLAVLTLAFGAPLLPFIGLLSLTVLLLAFTFAKNHYHDPSLPKNFYLL